MKINTDVIYLGILKKIEMNTDVTYSHKFQLENSFKADTTKLLISYFVI